MPSPNASGFPPEPGPLGIVNPALIAAELNRLRLAAAHIAKDQLPPRAFV
jgi:hypothetical protein